MNSYDSSKNNSPILMPLVFTLVLVALGVASRIVLIDSPNFKPVCALALFAGFYFNRYWLTGLVVASTLVVSDLMIGFYDWRMMAAVYGSTVLAAVLGWLIQNRPQSSPLQLLGRFGVASLVMSATFFLLTNFAVWSVGGWYPMTWAGLVECYAAAIPFFRWTLVSDFLFSQSFAIGYIAVAALDRKPANVDSVATP